MISLSAVLGLLSALDAVMGPPKVAGFGKRWLSLTVMV